jgi:pimeloyl-ACP methyl ester carboxylesterase
LDLVSLLDSLGIDKAILAGFDWDGVASCVVAALWPERVAGLVSYAGYDIVDREAEQEPVDPTLESVVWYQHLFHSERGRKCLARDRKKLCKLLWTQWSPKWPFSDELFNRIAASFDNEGFVDVVIAVYRHSLGKEAGDPELDDLERRLAAKPKIGVPCITLDGTQDPLKPGGSAGHAEMFEARHERREVDAGHALSCEAPEAFAKAILDLHQWVSGIT